ncbi:MAG: head-tail connector protein [Hyphomicrobiaceae bacterium]|nr:head-tail connector protein [Hyphomicrobiaceae bacterium]
MAMVLTSGPAIEPITIEEAKAHLRIDGTSEDALIASLILTSRLHIEAALDLALVDQSWTLLLDRVPRSGIVKVPISPLQSIDSIATIDREGLSTVVATETYTVDVASRPARIAFDAERVPSSNARLNGIEITLTAGYGATAAEVPDPIRQALLLLVAHWYEHRDPIEIGVPSTAIPQSVNRLLHPYRQVRL